MDRDRLYQKLDIETPEDFKYYENLDALIEEEEHVEEELIKELFASADMETLADQMDNFFESFLGNIPDEETELYILIDTFRSNITSAIFEDMDDEALDALASEVYKFRKWYAIDHNALDEISGNELSIRDARYEIVAAGFLGDDASIDFGKALTSGPDSYGIKLKDLTLID